jgi:hypothetical protein
MANDWRITGQKQETAIDGNSQFRDVIRVSFETIPEGYAGSVQIPLNMYGPEVVARAVQDRTDILKAVHQL